MIKIYRFVVTGIMKQGFMFFVVLYHLLFIVEK